MRTPQQVPAFLKGRQEFIAQLRGETQRFQFCVSPNPMAWPLIAQDPDDYLEAIEPRPIKTHDTMLWYFARPGLKVRCYVEAGEEERAIEWAESQLGPV